MKSLRLPVCIFLLLVSSFFCSFISAQESEEGYTAITTADPKIPVEDLELLLRPLTKEELIVEADAWRDVLKAKAQEISELETQNNVKSREIAKSKDEIKKLVQSIQDAQKKQEEQTDTPDVNSEQTEQKLQERAENIDQSLSEAENAVDVAEEANSVEELSSTEKDIVKKTEEVAEAKENLQATIEEIARSDIPLEEKVQKIGDAENQLNKKLKEQILVKNTKLREEQTGIIKRFETVLKALEDKGGEIKQYETYISVVSQMTLDFDNANELWIIISGWMKSPEGGLKWAINIILFFVILILTIILSAIAGKITNKTVSRSKRFSDLLKQFFVSIVSKTVFIFGLVMALSKLGFDIAPILAGLGVAGFVIGFALQGTLSNFASGLMILIYRPYDVGSVIEAAGVVGTVHTMNLVSTTIKTFDNQIIVIPNGSIWGGVVKNITGSDTRRVDMKFGISYTDDIAKAEKILKDIITSHNLVLKDPEPVIKLHELGDSSVNFVCRPWSKTSDYWNVYWDVTRAVKERFDKEGVSIPFPQRDVHLYKESE